MLLANILNPKVVYYEDKLDGPPGVAPQTRCRHGLKVARGIKALAEELVGKLP